ncbi:MAG TPA: hypothetical protein P5275_22270 [Saprospiraceae bacterium]|nr:hypothetical protein [Saprospiraceae bacterium]MCB9272344.1 hypothetical protein [Lewinellaceae bacterium]HPG06373.1 hypothetical protein [Saprospiraceae bacterium]HPR02038.1 hypothetical protein [Saprospiraceae bacterium]HRV87615.1 hypothetical protein [Saprospiraceae bacterium]
MKRLADALEEHLRRMPFIEEAMAEGLINLAALARRIQPYLEKQTGKSVRHEAILMALHRRNASPLLHITKSIREAIAKLGDILVRSNLEVWSFVPSGNLMARIRQTLDSVLQVQPAFYAFSQGIYETSMVISEHLAGSLESLIPIGQIRSRRTNLAAITILLPPGNTEMYGLYYFLLRALAWQGINVVELVSTANEFSVVVDADEVDKVVGIFMQVKRGEDL